MERRRCSRRDRVNSDPRDTRTEGRNLQNSAVRLLTKEAINVVRAVRTFFYNFVRLCVCAPSEPSGPEQASIELQVVILEWLGTAAKLAVHLAQVSQVDQVP